MGIEAERNRVFDQIQSLTSQLNIKFVMVADAGACASLLEMEWPSETARQIAHTWATCRRRSTLPYHPHEILRLSLWRNETDCIAALYRGERDYLAEGGTCIAIRNPFTCADARTRRPIQWVGEWLQSRAHRYLNAECRHQVGSLLSRLEDRLSMMMPRTSRFHQPRPERPPFEERERQADTLVVEEFPELAPDSIERLRLARDLVMCAALLENPLPEYPTVVVTTEIRDEEKSHKQQVRIYVDAEDGQKAWIRPSVVEPLRQIWNATAENPATVNANKKREIVVALGKLGECGRRIADAIKHSSEQKGGYYRNPSFNKGQLQLPAAEETPPKSSSARRK